MKIYTYWVDRDAVGMPAYIKMCMHTWQLKAPGVSVEIINHGNIHQYLPPDLLTPSFYQLSLPMQSDVVSVWVLLSRGGLFMDADTLMTRDLFSDAIFPTNAFSAFGYPQKKSIHLAVMSSPEPNNPLLAHWAERIARRLAQPLPEPLPWDYVGNGIVDALLKDEQYANAHRIIDAATSGNILEITHAKETAYYRYLDFYFSEPKEDVEQILSGARCGLISLHNSWTPDVYKKAGVADIVNTKETLLLSTILMHLCEIDR